MFDYILPVLGFLIILYDLPDFKNGISFKNISFLLLGAAIMVFSIIDKQKDDARREKDAANIEELKKRDSILSESVNKVGLKIDDKTGRIMVLDSQILERQLVRIASAKPVVFAAPSKNDQKDKKLQTAFDELSNNDVMKQEIAQSYVINSFPNHLNDAQIQEVVNGLYFPVDSAAPNRIKLIYLLSQQKQSKVIDEYFKSILENNPTDDVVWNYFFRKDVNIDLSYVATVIKNGPDYFHNYTTITYFAIQAKNEPIWRGLLNSQELIRFLKQKNINSNFRDTRAKFFQKLNAEKTRENGAYMNAVIDSIPHTAYYQTTSPDNDFFRKLIGGKKKS